LNFHHALRNRKYRLLFSSKPIGRPGPKGPSKELIEAVVQMKKHNPSYVKWADMCSWNRHAGSCTGLIAASFT
jgi:hypothetical protein